VINENFFVEKVRQTFTTSDAELLIKTYRFLKERVPAGDTISYQAATLLLNQGADAITIGAAMLALTVCQDPVCMELVQKHLGQEIARALENLNPSVALHFNEWRDWESGIHDLLAAMGASSRNAILLIAFRLLALEKAMNFHGTNANKMAQETLDIYVPIANRLSLGELRRRLEDCCFRILDRRGYEHLKKEVAPIHQEDKKCLQILMAGVKRLLKKKGIAGHIHGRTKSLYGIWNKMIRTGKRLEDILDRIGVRIIVDSVPECYSVLGTLHTHFKPVPGTFDDYIGHPKKNGYQSIHTCVYPVREISHKPIEFQVRTHLMHMEAEYGSAAHWRYKKSGESAAKDQNQTWMETLLIQHEQSGSTRKFIELLHEQAFADQVVVFGNGGRIIRLAENSTVQDFLTVSNVTVPKNAVVRVNGRLSALDTLLHDGDSVEITIRDDLTVQYFNEIGFYNDQGWIDTWCSFDEMLETYEPFDEDHYWKS